MAYAKIDTISTYAILRIDSPTKSPNLTCSFFFKWRLQNVHRFNIKVLTQRDCPTFCVVQI